MDAKAMKPFGKALCAYFGGESSAELIVRRDDGKEVTIPVSLFFRDESDFSEIERTAMRLCKGRVLDIGAGAGSHSLALQRKGHLLTAIDICPDAVAVARERGVADALSTDILTYEGGPFDTLLMIGHGIGMVETIEGLTRFLHRAHSLLAAGGQLLVDSLDVGVTSDSEHHAYQEANRSAGRYIGEIRMEFEFRGLKGPYCGWLHVDVGTLTEHSQSAGWRCEVVHQGENGEYLARLTNDFQLAMHETTGW
jgi:SAM-dependent methyltransferase